MNPGLVGALASLLCACALAPRIAVAAPPSQYASLVDRVVAVRGIKPSPKIVVAELDDDAYTEQFQRFDRSPPPSSSRAFLARKTSVIYVRSGAKEELLVELIATALLNQRFSFGERVEKLGKSEAAEALEGFGIADRGLVQLLLTDPTKPELAKHVLQLYQMSPEKAVAARRIDAGILKERPVVIKQVMMKNAQSLALLTKLYLAGGWDLVNRAWTSPPIHLSELADPKGYIDGTRASASLPEIPLARGTTTIENAGALNEAEVYGFLLDLPRSPEDSTDAIILSDAQRGFAVHIVKRPEYGNAYVVVSAWDSPEHAARFVSRWLRIATPVKECAPFAKQLDKAVVATDCLATAESERLITELLPKIGPIPPARPPLGPMKLPSLDAK